VNPQDAEEYTQALGQVVAGSWRQIALGQRLGVPKSLGISTSDWVEQRLGGYVRLSIPERREAVKELTAPIEEGGQGMSNRQAAEVLGVAPATVDRDIAPATNEADDLSNNHEARRRGAPNEAPFETLADAVARTPTLLDDLPSPSLSKAERAYTNIGPLLRWIDTDPVEVAATPAPEDVEDRIRTVGNLLDWLNAIHAALQERLHRPMTVVRGGKAG
jgi:hypothetical protein